jgi:hypothetical protein
MPGVTRTTKKTEDAPPPEKAKKTPPPPKADAESENDGGDDSFANLFDKAKAQGQVSDGKFDAIIREFVLQEKNEKGQAARLKYHIISDGDEQGSEVTQFYNIRTPDNQPGNGLGFLKRDLAMLGYNDFRFGDLENIFEEIVENEGLGVMITVKNNPPFVNAYLNGIMPDEDDARAYREAHPW